MKFSSILLAFGCGSMLPCQAALLISSLNTTSTIDFSEFTGSGFAPSPAAGQLDSDTWRVTGLSDAIGTFGGTHTTGDFARGTSAGGVTTGGVYAFDVDPTAGVNRALGVQPTTQDFNPGAFTLRIQNTTGDTVSNWNLSYALYVLNNEGRSSTLDWAWSTNDVAYTNLSTYASPVAADANGWTNVQNPSVTNLSATVANNGYLYLRWNSVDVVGGGGSRDEFAIDNISVTAVPESSAALLGAFGALALLRRRR